MSISSNHSDPEPGDPNRSRVYRPPVGRNHAARPAADHAWTGARSVLVILAAVLGLASLSVAGAHFLPGPTSALLGGTSAAPSASGTTSATDLAASSTTAAPETPAQSPSEPAPTPTQDATSRLATLTDPVGGANVTLDVTFGQAHTTLHQTDLAPLIASNGGQPTLNNDALQALASNLSDQWDQSMVNARFNFNGGNLAPIRDSQEGRTLDQAAAATAIGQALLGGQSSVTLPGKIVPPQVSSDNPQALGITTNLDRGSTSFAGSIPEKAQNIRLAADRLNGVVVPPGGTFSFNDEVGPTTLDAGFEWGFGIEASADGARTVPSVAGGICQVATTLFQRVFWSGFPMVERHWHLYWIPAYTTRGLVGLDATVDEDSGLDFQWSNPTDGYVLIQSATDDSNVYFGLYGSEHNWKVQVDDPQVTHRVAADPAPIAQAEPSLPWGKILPVESARDGFDVAITRTVTREDGQPRALTVQSSYEPSRTVTLVGTKNKPANADVDAVLARIAPPTRAPATASASASPSPSPSPVELNAPAPGGTTLATESSSSATPAAKPTAAATAQTSTQGSTTSGGQTPTAIPASTRAPATSAPAATAAATPVPGANVVAPTRTAAGSTSNSNAATPTAAPATPTSAPSGNSSSGATPTAVSKAQTPASPAATPTAARH
jgi:vancomycin resistance protein YoaR